MYHIVTNKRFYDYYGEKIMSLSKNTKSQIKEYILDKIGENEDVVDKVRKCFNVSNTTVYRYLNELVDDGAIGRKKKRKVCFSRKAV